MRKRIFAMFLTIVMVLGVTVPMHSMDTQAQLLDEIVGTSMLFEVDGFMFEITESVDNYYRVTRTLERDASLLARADHADLAEARAALYALGMQPIHIELMPEDELMVIATSPLMSATISYIEEDEQGNTRYVSGDYAVMQAAQINAHVFEQMDALASDELSIAPMLRPTPPEVIGGTSYIRIYHLVTRMANPMQYMFHSQAIWLSMPTFRNFGSLGSIASQMEFIVGSGRGLVHYNRHFANTVDFNVRDIPASDLSGPVPYHGWVGGGAVFRLPRDTTSDAFPFWYTNFGATYSFRGQLPQSVSVFTSRATYTHRTVNISLSPSIFASTTGVGVSLGIGFNWQHNLYHVSVNVFR